MVLPSFPLSFYRPLAFFASGNPCSPLPLSSPHAHDGVALEGFASLKKSLNFGDLSLGSAITTFYQAAP